MSGVSGFFSSTLKYSAEASRWLAASISANFLLRVHGIRKGGYYFGMNSDSRINVRYVLSKQTSESCCAGSAGGSPAVWTVGSFAVSVASSSCDQQLMLQRCRGHDPRAPHGPNRAPDSQRRTSAWLLLGCKIKTG